MDVSESVYQYDVYPAWQDPANSDAFKKALTRDFVLGSNICLVQVTV